MNKIYLREIKRNFKYAYGIRIPVNNILSVVHFVRNSQPKPGTLISEVHIIHPVNNTIVRYTIVHKFNRRPKDNETLYLNDNYKSDEVYNNILTNKEVKSIIKVDSFIIDDNLSIYHLSNLKPNHTNNNLKIIDAL